MLPIAFKPGIYGASSSLFQHHNVLPTKDDSIVVRWEYIQPNFVQFAAGGFAQDTVQRN
jgi:hypothetical protein